MTARDLLVMAAGGPVVALFVLGWFWVGPVLALALGVEP